MRAMAEGLPSIHRDPHDLEARARARHAAWHCRSVLGAVGMAEAMRCDDAPVALYVLARQNGAPTSLRKIGLAASDLDSAADFAMPKP